MIIFR